MRIVYLAAGAANMFCGSCLHDNTLAAALRLRGADVLLVPTYTPLRTDEENVSEPRVFYGGINVYLQQKSALFRHTPWFLDRWLDSPGLIKWLTSRAASTKPQELGDLTVSMLRGEEGRQRKELDKLIDWLRHQVRPDVIHLSNSMLVGMARELQSQLGVPVACTLSGEDIFLEQLIEPHYTEARQVLRERVRDVAAFVALNRYFADFMADYADIPRERIHVIPHGLKLDGHGTRAAREEGAVRTIGYLARICPEKGLHLLVEAFHRLCDDATLPPVRLRVAGYLGEGDRAYLAALQARIAELGLADRFEYVGEVDRRGKIEFLQSLDVMSVPTVYRESKGLSILEALANAVPVVLPAHGTFPELVADTQGGLLHQPLDPGSLAEQLAIYVRDRVRATRDGLAGQAAVRERYNDDVMAARTLEFYRLVVAGSAGSPSRTSQTAAETR
ncbi:MAG: glycosyltransferase family 4 protein [Pirellulales bacterium]|nr:glycosyltransferase family 4 protein [Pirellulales bacterium]